VIGGGPAGMEAAIISADRGYKVTLYEQADRLGGQLNVAEVPYMKWTMKKFKDYMIHQVEKKGIDVKLNTKVVPGMLETEKYDAVFVALGAEAKHLAIPGAEALMTAVDALENPEQVRGDVVVIGGGETGVETGMHFAKLGHKVTVLCRQEKLAPDAVPIHFYSLFRKEWESLPNFSYELEVKYREVQNGTTVVYEDKDGQVKQLAAGTIIVAGGMGARSDEAMALNGMADKTFYIGDCNRVGSIQTAMRTAFGAASSL
jgi:NADPH-dependent 2,4-dienoyl-CoA reductase/sulfur reductase-like enzyme